MCEWGFVGGPRDMYIFRIFQPWVLGPFFLARAEPRGQMHSRQEDTDSLAC